MMKNAYILAFLILSSSLNLQGQYYIDTLSSQQQVDAFPINYPDCSHVLGNLIIIGEGIYSLDSLYAIEKIDSTFEIENTLITSTRGLNNLDSVGARLRFYHNFELDSIIFSSLKSITGKLSVNSNPTLIYIEFNEELTYLGSLLLFSNVWLHNLDGFKNINNIGGNLSIALISINNLDALLGLKKINGGLFIAKNVNLENLNGLINLEQINGPIVIGGLFFGSYGDNPNLTSLNGLENIDPGTITSLEISYNSSLTLCHLPNICEFIENDSPDYSNALIYNNLGACSYIDSVIVACNPLSIHEVLAETIQVFPNPTQGIVNIDLADLQDASIKVIDVNGRLIYHQDKIAGPSFQFELNEAPGIYILEVTSSKQTFHYKLIKNQ